MNPNTTPSFSPVSIEDEVQFPQQETTEPITELFHDDFERTSNMTPDDRKAFFTQKIAAFYNTQCMNDYRAALISSRGTTFGLSPRMLHEANLLHLRPALERAEEENISPEELFLAISQDLETRSPDGVDDEAFMLSHPVAPLVNGHAS